MSLPRAGALLTASVLVLALNPSATATGSPAPASVADSPLAVHAKARGATLDVSPTSYVAGQSVRFTGKLSKRGKRRITMQLHMHRPGDSWFPVRGFNGRTDKSGSFDFKFPAPAMRGISYRVVAKGAATPPVTFNSASESVSLWLDDEAVAGQPFALTAQHTPAYPSLFGRGLRLERRISPTDWQVVARSTVTASSTTFGGLVESQGTVVYRVVAEDITSGGNAIGWFQSFPLHVTVGAPGTTTEPSLRPVAPARLVAPAARRARRAAPIAASRYGWFPAIYDYAWEAGQSLDSPAELGSDTKGRWEQYSDGTGRVIRQNGGLEIQSGMYDDFGTTRATLRGTSQVQGRWEAKLRLISGRIGNYRTLVELVPERASDYDCGRHNIALADIDAPGTTMSFGVKAGAKQWTGQRQYGPLTLSHSLAVELGKKHITWFFNGQPIGSVSGKKVVPGVPMTLRFSVVDDGAQGRSSTWLNSDWQRSFEISRGRQVKKGPKLTRSSVTGCE